MIIIDIAREDFLEYCGDERVVKAVVKAVVMAVVKAVVRAVVKVVGMM